MERIGEDDPEGEDLLRGEWEEGDREVARVAAELCEGTGSGLHVLYVAPLPGASVSP